MAYTPESGDIWINRTEKGVRFNLDGTNYSVIPSAAWFTAGEAITFGKAVSMATTEWQAAEPSVIPGRVYLTDSALGTKTFGLCRSSSVAAGNPVEVQMDGLFEWPIGSDIFGENDQGKIVYVDPTDGDLTTDRVAAALGSSALIEIGIVKNRDSLILAPEGDGLGLNSAQLQYIVGESINLGTLSYPTLVAQSNVDGRVYLADKRKSVCDTKHLTNVIGFIVPGPYSVLDPLASVLVQTSGAMGGFTGLIPGQAVLAGDDGTITQSTSGFNYLTDNWHYVGVANSETSILLRVGMVEGTTDINQIGAIIAKGQTSADSDYISCTGQTLDSVADHQYADLYAMIGTYFGGTGASDFDLPDMSSFGTYGAQIRYRYTYDAPSDRIDAPIMRWDSGWIDYSSALVAGTGIDVLVTSFGSDTPLDETEVVLYAREKALPNTTARKIEPVVVDYFNGTTHIKYGYQVSKPSADYIKFKIAPGGLAYLDGTDYVVLTPSWEVKACVFKTEKFNRFYDYTGDHKLKALWDLGVASYTRANENTPVEGLFHRGSIVPASYSSVLNYEGTFSPTRLTTAGDLTIGTTAASSIVDEAVLTTLESRPANVFPLSANVKIGAETGQTFIRNNLVLGGSITLNGTALITNDTEEFTLLPIPSTIHFGEACGAMSIGALTGATTIRNATTNITGTLNVVSGNITSSAATLNIAPAGISSVINIAPNPAVTKTINIGSGSSTDTVNIPSTKTYALVVGTNGSGGGIQTYGALNALGGGTNTLAGTLAVNGGAITCSNSLLAIGANTATLALGTGSTNINIGTDANAKTITLGNTGDAIRVLSTVAAAESGTNAALYVAGGIGVGGSIRVVGDVIATNFYGNAASLTSGVASAVTVSTANVLDAIYPVALFESATGNLQCKTSRGPRGPALTYNNLSGALSSISFSGAGTGLTGTASSLTSGFANGAAGLYNSIDGTASPATGVVNVNNSGGPVFSNSLSGASNASITLYESNRSGATGTAPRVRFIHNGASSSAQLSLESSNILAARTGNGDSYTPFRASAFYATSARSAKKDIKTFLGRALDIVNNTLIVSYKYKEEEIPHIGFIADDTPEELTGPNKDIMSVNDCLGVLIKAIQELDIKYRALVSLIDVEV